MSRPRKQTYALATYLKKIHEKDISNDANVQRNFVWSNVQIGELVITVLTDDYITPIILCEEENSQLRIADGGQRTAALNIFRYCNKKISPSVEDPLIPYKKKIMLDSGEVIWEDAVFNVKNKTYDQLPDELKKTFDDYQIETVIHENCDMSRIAKYIKRYNNHVSMNTNQKGFTNLDKFADIVRRIIKMDFFVNHSNFTDTEKNKGSLERTITETIMCSNYLQDWKKDMPGICKFLNQNADIKVFEKLEENLHRLEYVVTDETKTIFNSKDAFIFLTLFDKFTSLGFQDCRFNEFLTDFQNTIRSTAHNENGKLFDEIDKDLGTKDKIVVMAKLDMLTKLLNDFLGISEGQTRKTNMLEFIRDNVDSDIVEEDVELYESCLDDYTVKVDDNPILIEYVNHKSLVAVMAYAFITDKDSYMEDWICNYFKKNSDYIKDQQQNYIHMKEDFDKFCQGKAA